MAVLYAVTDANRPVETSTIREQMHWAESSSQVGFRLDKLEDRGLVETWHDVERAEAHQMLPRVAEATSAGEAIADDHRDDPATLPTEDRLNRLENQLGRMKETYGEVKQQLVEVENELEAHDDDLDDLAKDIRSLVYAVERLEDSLTTASEGR